MSKTDITSELGVLQFYKSTTQDSLLSHVLGLWQSKI